MANPFVIVGLGNPGQKYAETRHNAGFWFLDGLADQTQSVFRAQTKLHSETAGVILHGQDCILVKPLTFMNHSGRAVRAVLDYFKVVSSRLLVAYDDLDLPPGITRLKAGGGHGGHNGLRDIFDKVQDRDFLRLRIGIGHPGLKEQVTPYVLSRPRLEEEISISRAISAAQEVMPDVLSGSLASAQTKLHTAVDQEKQ